MARGGASPREKLEEHAQQLAAGAFRHVTNEPSRWLLVSGSRRRIRNLLAAVVREELKAAAERATVAIAGRTSVRAAILSRPRLTRARERKSR